MLAQLFPSVFKANTTKTYRLGPMPWYHETIEKAFDRRRGVLVMQNARTCVWILGLSALLTVLGCPVQVPIPGGDSRPQAAFQLDGLLIAKDAWPEAAPLETRIFHLPNGIDIEMVHISAGRFTMGAGADDPAALANERPAREVVLTRDFWLATTELNRATWKAFMGTEPWPASNGGVTDALLPATGMGYNQAVLFAGNLSAVTGAAFRLPTEAEWEMACRAGGNTAYALGDDPALLTLMAWSGLPAVTAPQAPGLLMPNAWGFYDMHGNVREFCVDGYAANAYSTLPEVDPVGSETLRDIVVRGGALSEGAPRLRSASRVGYPRVGSTFGTPMPGIRLAMDSPGALPGASQASAAALDLQWVQVADVAPWGPRAGHNALIFGPRMLVLAGESADAEGNRVVHRDVWSTSDGAAWTLLLDEAPWPARSDAAVAILHDALWLLGGRDGEGALLHDVWRSEDGVTWTEVTASGIWGPRAGHAALEYRGHLVVIGGEAPGGSARGDVWFSSDGRDWSQTTQTEPYGARIGLGAAVHEGYLVVTGGHDGTGLYPEVRHTFDGIAWDITEAAPAFAPRTDHGFTPFAGKLWVLGGETAGGLTNGTAYSAMGTEWKSPTTAAPWPARKGHAVVNAGSSLWLLGGHGDGGYLGDIWVGLAAVESYFADARLDGAMVYEGPPNLLATQEASIMAAVSMANTGPLQRLELRFALPNGWTLNESNSDLADAFVVQGEGTISLIWPTPARSSLTVHLAFRTGAYAGETVLAAWLTATANGESTSQALPPLTVNVREPAPPVAAFTASPLTGPAPLAIAITDESVAGDLPIITRTLTIHGPQGESQHPYSPGTAYTLSNPGEYSLSFTVFDGFHEVTIELGESIVLDDSEGGPLLQIAVLPNGQYAPGGIVDLEVQLLQRFPEDRVTQTQVLLDVPQDWELELLSPMGEHWSIRRPNTDQRQLWYWRTWSGDALSTLLTFRVPETSTEPAIIRGQGIFTYTRSGRSQEYIDEISPIVIESNGKTPPSVAFTATPSEGRVPFAVRLTDTSSGDYPITQWAWYVQHQPQEGNTPTLDTWITLTNYPSVALRVYDGHSANQRFEPQFITTNSPIHFTREAVGGPFYTPGEPLTISITMHSELEWPVTALGLIESAPPGWTLVTTAGADKPAIAAQTSGRGIEFAWISIPAMPFTFTYTVAVPADAAPTAEISGQVEYRLDGGQESGRPIFTSLSAREAP
jgi:formylglycine-generating enzyme required for sulfatase activity